MKRRNFDSNLYAAVDIEKVSAQSLPKMGTFPSRAGDFLEILAEVVHLRRPHKRAVMHRNPLFQGVLIAKLATI
jgi:hypothetical protein